MAVSRGAAALATASILLTWGRTVTADCNVSSNYTIIDAPSDADGISSCADIDGSLSLLFDNSPSSWPEDNASVDLGDVAAVKGDLVIYPGGRSSKTTVTAESLASVDGELTISVNDVGSTVDDFELSFPALESVTSNYVVTGDFRKLSLRHADSLAVEGMVRVNDIAVENLQLDGVESVAKDFSIDSNGNLQSLSVDTLKTAGQGLSVTQNGKLSDVSFKSLQSVKGDINIYQNEALTELELPALESAGTISFTQNGDSPSLSLPRLASLGNSNSSSTSNFESVSKVRFASLRNVNGSLSFQSTALSDLTIPLLRNLNGSITIEDNPSLTTFALPRVTSVVDIFVKSNDKLTNVTANALKSVGSISLRGSFTNVEFFGLKEVTGDVSIIGDDSLDCYWFDKNLKPLVSGKFTCVGSHEESDQGPSTGGIENTEGNPEDYMDPSSDDSDGGSGSSNESGGSNNEGSDGNGGDGGASSRGGLSTGAKAGIGVGVAVAVALIIAAIVFCCLRRKKRHEPSTIPPVMQQTRISSSSDNVMVGGGAISDSSSWGGEDASAGSNFDSNRASVFSGNQMLGVQTKIEAGPPSDKSSSSSKLGILKFGRRSLMGSGAKRLSDKSLGPWKTVRRVSDPSVDGSQSNANSDISGREMSEKGSERGSVRS